MTQRRQYLRSLAGLVAVGALAGCTGSGETTDQGDGAGDDGGTETEEPAETPTEQVETTVAEDDTGTSESVGQQEYPDYNWGILDDESPETAAAVEMRGFAYHPVVARVPAGTEISFPNQDSSAHTVTIPARDIDEDVGGGEDVTVTIDEPGTYDYVCTLHPPDMLGRLVVEEGLTVDDGGGSDDDTDDGTSTPPGGDY